MVMVMTSVLMVVMIVVLAVMVVMVMVIGMVLTLTLVASNVIIMAVVMMAMIVIVVINCHLDKNDLGLNNCLQHHNMMVKNGMTRYNCDLVRRKDKVPL